MYLSKDAANDTDFPMWSAWFDKLTMLLALFPIKSSRAQ
jgi:hypothetical protein